MRYRIHLTCKPGHKTYQDYTRKVYAALANFTGIMPGWYCYKVEFIK